MAEEKGSGNFPANEILGAVGEIAEMRRIYAAVGKSLPHPGNGSIVVGSATISEGKTLTVSGLAAMAAREGERRVLAIDLNWFRPTLHTVFGLERTFSVDQLMAHENIADLARKSEINHLDVLVAPLPEQNGHKNGADLNALAERIIKQAREAYDLSIVDTSALYPMNRHMLDPAVFSWKADGVVLVALVHKTPRKKVKRALMALKASGAQVLGVVINTWEAAATGRPLPFPS